MQQRVHSPPITRGPQDNGPAGLPCSACHTEANYDHARVPGAPGWHGRCVVFDDRESLDTALHGTEQQAHV